MQRLRPVRDGLSTSGLRDAGTTRRAGRSRRLPRVRRVRAQLRHGGHQRRRRRGLRAGHHRGLVDGERAHLRLRVSRLHRPRTRGVDDGRRIEVHATRLHDSAQVVQCAEGSNTECWIARTMVAEDGSEVATSAATAASRRRASACCGRVSRRARWPPPTSRARSPGSAAWSDAGRALPAADPASSGRPEEQQAQTAREPDDAAELAQRAPRCARRPRRRSVHLPRVSSTTSPASLSTRRWYEALDCARPELLLELADADPGGSLAPGTPRALGRSRRSSHAPGP